MTVFRKFEVCASYEHLWLNRHLRQAAKRCSQFYKDMRIHYNDYIIDLINDDNFTLNSTDNITSYLIEYFDGTNMEDRFYPTSKYGIRIIKDDLEINSAIICEIGTGTTIHKNSFVINNDNLMICCADKVYSIGLPDLKLNWKNRIDPATCFGIYKFEDDFIVHGELEISRINIKGEIKWQFGARDIFVLPDGSRAFSIIDNKIHIKDWENNEYILDSNGMEIVK